MNIENQPENWARFDEELRGIRSLINDAAKNNTVININFYHAPIGHIFMHAERVITGVADRPEEGYSDEQIAQALRRIVGRGKAIDSKQKWAGAYWYLRWTANYPATAMSFCEKIARLLPDNDLEYPCDYRNIRELATLSFMEQDPRQMDKVRPSKNDERVFWQCREVALKLADELSRKGLTES